MYFDSNPLFSVIIPCYNAVDWICRALQSLEKQTFRNFEAVLVDDCSTDGTYEMLLQYQATSTLTVQVLRNVRNSGPGASRNYGIREARGKYIAFMDSDDWYEPSLLEQVYHRIETSGAELVFYDFCRCFENGKKVTGRYTRNYAEGMPERCFIALCFESMWTLVVRKTIFGQVNLPELYNAEDVVTVPLLASKASRIAFIPQPLYNYYYRAGSLCTGRDQKIVESYRKAYEYLREQYDRRYEDEFEFCMIKMVLYGIVYNAVRSKMKMREIKPVIRAFRQEHPRWKHNPYLKTLPLRKVFFIRCASAGGYFLLRGYCRLQEYLLLRNAKDNE